MTTDQRLWVPEESAHAIIRLASAADSDALSRLEHPTLQILLRQGLASNAVERGVATVILAAVHGDGVVGAAWLDIEPTGEAFLGLALDRSHRRRGVELELARGISATARERSVVAMTTRVPYIASHVFEHLRNAGLRVVSSVSHGGIATVTLMMQPESAELHFGQAIR